jgi:hypothetical protein
MRSGGGSDARLGPPSELLRLENTSSLTGLSDGEQAAHAFPSDEWKAAAPTVVHELASIGGEFSIDDVRLTGIKEPDKHRRWGILLSALKNEGVIERIGSQERQTAKGDGNLVRSWRGTVFASKKGA